MRARYLVSVTGFGQALVAVSVVVGLVLGSPHRAHSQSPAGTAFTYQGRLTDAGAPANGPYDFQLVLYTADVGGTQVGPTVTIDDLPVVDGLFTVGLDFGPGMFVGEARFLEIGVRPGASGGPYTVLGARQELKPAPHAVFTQKAPWTGISGKPPGFADDADNDVLGGLACGSGEVAKWNGSAWACATDADTTYSAGAGLGLSGTVFSVADLGVTTPKVADNAVTTPKVADASIATAKLADSAVTSIKIADGTIGLSDLGQNGCGPNQVLKWNGTSWACAADEGTGYTAGAGLDLTGNVFSVADLGVTTLKLADNAVTSAKISDGTIGLADLGQNGCGSDQILKWNGVAWACAADSDTNSGGTVTSVGTGAGLTGGPITSSGIVAVATGGITSSLIANGAVGLAQINQLQVQAAVVGFCPIGQYLRRINSDGTVLCDQLLGAGHVTIVEGMPISDTAIAIGADNLPVIAYSNSALAAKVAHCVTSTCTGSTAITTLEAVGSQSVAVAIGTDGLPIISYDDNNADTLKVAHCGNAACTSGNTLTTVDGTAPGLDTSIAIGADGLPVVSYHDNVLHRLKVAHCGNNACTSGNAVAVVDDPVLAGSDAGLYSSIAIGADGLPVVSYQYTDATNSTLRVAHCGNSACTSANTVTTVDDPANVVGLFTSIVIGIDGFPTISYQDATANSLKVAHCGNSACTSGNSLTTVDNPLNGVGIFTSIAIGTDGLPIIGYGDFTAGTLKAAHCGNSACSSGAALTTVVDGGNGFASMTIGADGYPIMSYFRAGTGPAVAKCASNTCP